MAVSVLFYDNSFVCKGKIHAKGQHMGNVEACAASPGPEALAQVWGRAAPSVPFASISACFLS
jgi:hypothetical protein